MALLLYIYRVTAKREYSYVVVDVFTQVPLEGNPLAVFPDARGLDDATMQKIAKETNLSETTFVFPATRPDCSASVRIFTPAKEMDFAGHPTVGTSFVLMEQRIVPKNSARFVLEEKVGPVPVRVEAGDQGRLLIWFSTPPIRFGKTYDPALCAQVLGLTPSDLLPLPPQMLSAGNPAAFIGVKTKEAVDRAWVDLPGIQTLRGEQDERICVFVFTPTAGGVYTRMFAPEHGIAEDPASGSLTGPVAALMMKHGLVPGAAGRRLISEQGTKLGRRSILHIQINGNNGASGIEVGGYVTPISAGTMTLS